MMIFIKTRQYITMFVSKVPGPANAVHGVVHNFIRVFQFYEHADHIRIQIVAKYQLS